MLWFVLSATTGVAYPFTISSTMAALWDTAGPTIDALKNGKGKKMTAKKGKEMTAKEVG